MDNHIWETRCFVRRKYKNSKQYLFWKKIPIKPFPGRCFTLWYLTIRNQFHCLKMIKFKRGKFDFSSTEFSLDVMKPKLKFYQLHSKFDWITRSSIKLKIVWNKVVWRDRKSKHKYLYYIYSRLNKTALDKRHRNMSTHWKAE